MKCKSKYSFIIYLKKNLDLQCGTQFLKPLLHPTPISVFFSLIIDPPLAQPPTLNYINLTRWPLPFHYGHKHFRSNLNYFAVQKHDNKYFLNRPTASGTSKWTQQCPDHQKNDNKFWFLFPKNVHNASFFRSILLGL
jgi:hypothetical protein